MGQATVAEPSYAFRRHSRNGGANGPSHASGRQFHYARAGSAGVAPPTSATLLLDRRCLGRSRLAMARGPGAAAAPYELDRSPAPADRKSAAQGNSVSVRVDFGGRRIINTAPYQTSHAS